MRINFNNFNVNALQPKNDFEKEVVDFIKEWFSETSTVKVSTSGSTGAPKIFEIGKEKMRNSANMTCDFFNFKEGDTALLCLPIAYISGKMMMVRAIERKMSIEIESPSVRPLLNLKNSVDFCAMIPLQVENSLHQIHLIKNLIIGGAQVSENLKLKIFEVLQDSNSDCRIFETYGMSETLSHIALKQIYPESENYFTVLDGIKISQNTEGCLIIEAPKLNSEILKTNDIVDLIDEEHFQFLGRADFVINSGGAKIFPEELENFVKKELLKLGIENEVIFSSLEDNVLGQKLVLIIEGEHDEKIIKIINEIQFKKNFFKPKEIFFLDQFPRSENGKILRKEFFK